MRMAGPDDVPRGDSHMSVQTWSSYPLPFFAMHYPYVDSHEQCRYTDPALSTPIATDSTTYWLDHELCYFIK